jgi:MFS family permease
VPDAAGRKLICVYGFAVFTLASAGCGLAPGLGWLVAARVVQALGAAMLQANSIALITTTVAGRRSRWYSRRPPGVVRSSASAGPPPAVPRGRHAVTPGTHISDLAWVICRQGGGSPK